MVRRGRGALAGAPAGQGWDLVLNARTAGVLEDAARELRGRFRTRVVAVPGDVTDAAHRADPVAAALGLVQEALPSPRASGTGAVVVISSDAAEPYSTWGGYGASHEPPYPERFAVTGLREPQASHLLTLEAVAGREALRRGYEAAPRKRYLWHEFGDVHLVLPDKERNAPDCSSNEW